MVKLNKIYTRTGDSGTTGLGDGSRRAKYDMRVEAYGTVDEANSVIGLVRLNLDGQVKAEGIDALLSRIQNDLFDLGADLCRPYSDNEEHALRMSEDQVTALEEACDLYNEDLAPLTSFTLPGGSPASSYLHLARTVSRRAERLTAELAHSEDVNKNALSYLNRLSDLFFILSRTCNNEGATDVLWVPGANR